MVANLWDVTDRDIDRFCQSLLKSWLEEGGGEQQGSGESGRDNSASGPLGVRDETTEPRDQDGDGEGVGSRGVSAGTVRCGMSKAVASSREACKLPHLIGAAPVCYGVPVAVSWRGTQG